ncbi:MAG TPA: tetratricopeptide repeat protein, partial [Solirubrobacterales bacterium]|nr:tetratricopeptide repeat protein [Solirubrobacterales bacterium]
EDHEDPLGELRRLVRLGRCYTLMREADESFAAGDTARAADLYVEAWEGAPENHELRFWAALALVERGESERGVALLRESIDAHPGWRQMVDRLTVEMLPSIEEVRRLLGDYGIDGGAGPT